MSNALSLPPTALAPGGSLTAYVGRVNALPMLSADEERSLAERFRNDNDIEAARQLVLAHLRFVTRVAAGYSGYGLPQGDLIQEGNVGLMKAVKRFDPDVGVRLVSFAVHWIRAEMHEYILRNWRIVKVATTKAQRKLFFNLRSAKKRLGWMNQTEVEAVAADLGVSASDVLEMEQRLAARDAAFDGPSDDDDSISAPAHYLESHSPQPDQQLADAQDEAVMQGRLHSGLEALDDRSRTIVAERWLSEEKTTLQALAARYSVSAERIRQIEQAAFKKLKTHFGDLPLLTAQ